MPDFPFDAVLLDADETIFDFLEAEKESVLKTAQSFDINADEEDARIYSSINLSFWKQLEEGTVTREELKVLRFKKWFEFLGELHTDPYAFAASYEDTLSRTGILLEGAEEFIKRLSALCPVYIVTNGLSKCQHGRMDKSPVRKYISGLFISEEIGYTKPDRRFFYKVFEAIGITERAKVIIIGDSLTSDMQGGRNAGIKTCRYSRFATVENNPLCDYTITDYNQFFDIFQ
ncbi:MAG: YjjG family noncanonical pyrimidine nucleotidase [Ruminococcus sp.]|nr:YjjG family noncanonical pyrimidine nucleotidase [Ruminococcus sp.]